MPAGSIMEIKQEKNGNIIIKGKQSSLTLTHSHIQTDSIAITGPGEYEVGGIQIVGLSSNRETNFKITVDNLNIVVLYGKISDKQEETFSNIDVLIPVTSDKASQLVVKLEPKIVVIPGTNDQSTLVKELGREVTQAQRLVVKKESLPAELEVVWLKSM